MPAFFDLPRKHPQRTRTIASQLQLASAVVVWLIAANMPILCDSLAIADETQKSATAADHEWGPAASGLRCRIRTVSSATKDESPEPATLMNSFSSGDDLTIAVELQNVTKRPIYLMSVRKHDEAVGNNRSSNASQLGPLLFHFEFADADGKPIPRVARELINDDLFLLHQPPLHSIAPGESLTVLLRPARFTPPMDYHLSPGRYRVVVRYHGPDQKQLSDQLFRQMNPDFIKRDGWTDEVTSQSVPFTIEKNTSSHTLSWGSEKEGLQAAVEFLDSADRNSGIGDGYQFPSKPNVRTIFHIKNVSSRSIQLVSETGRQLDPMLAIDDLGDKTELKGTFFTGLSTFCRWTLKPGEIVQLQSISGAVSGLDRIGNFQVQFRIDFGSVSLKDGTGHVKFPLPEDFKQTLLTGVVPVTITRRAEVAKATHADDHNEVTEIPKFPLQKPEPIALECLDQLGNPVQGAELYLFQYSGFAKRYRQFGPYLSDPGGKVVCDQSLFSNSAGDYDRWIYARVPNQSAGFIVSGQWRIGQFGNRQGKIHLLPSRALEGSITVPAGFDVTKVSVRIRRLEFDDRIRRFKFDNRIDVINETSFLRDEALPGLNTALPDIFECHPDSDGIFQFKDVPAESTVVLEAFAAGLGYARWQVTDLRNQRHRLQHSMLKEHRLSGQVMTPDDRPAAGMSVIVQLRSDAMGSSNDPPRFLTMTDADGGFEFRGLPDLQYALTVLDPAKRYTFRPIDPVLNLKQARTGLKLKMETGILVSGQFTGSSGKAIPFANLTAVTTAQPRSILDQCTTDEEGRYELRLPNCNADIYSFRWLPSNIDPNAVKRIKRVRFAPGREDVKDFELSYPRGDFNNGFEIDWRDDI